MKLFSIWTSGSGDVVLKISYLELWWPSCSADQNHLCNFGRGHLSMEEHLRVIILNLDQWCRSRCRLMKNLRTTHNG